MNPLTLAGPITFTISPRRIEARAGTLAFHWEAVVYFAVAEKKPKLLGIGADPPHGPHVRVELFRPGSPLPTGMTKGEALERFFCFAMKQIIDRHVFRIKPDVRVIGLESLDSVLAGYQEIVFTKVLEMAGARRLTFVPLGHAGSLEAV